MRRVEVDWLDSVQLNYGWTHVGEYVEIADQAGNMEHRTSGFLIDEDKRRVLVALSTNDLRGHVTQVMMIPRCAITAIRDVK